MDSSRFELTNEAIPERWLAPTPPCCGAVVLFDGVVRNHHQGRAVAWLEYEAYRALALAEGQRIVADAVGRFGVERAAAIHRIGRLEVGDAAVRVAAWGHHRDESFAACRFIIDEIKARVPIWKLEVLADGSRSWVECAACAAHQAEDRQPHRH